MLKKLQEQISKNIKRFIKKDGRVGFELRELNQMFRMDIPIKGFTEVLGRYRSVLAVFKVLILLHRLSVEGTQCPTDISDILTSLSYCPKDDFQKLLVFRLMNPYRLYLQRRALIDNSQLSETSQAEKQVRVYQLLNLITLATSFSDIIYTFGRYYIQKFTCAVDFNIILGADLQILYQKMIDCVARPASREILDEIQVLHEKMYVIFYNCYFHRYLKNYIPKWVITDPLAAKRHASPSKYSGKSTNDRTTSKTRSFSSAKTKTVVKQTQSLMGESQLFLKQQVAQEVEQNQEDEDLGHSWVSVKDIKKEVQLQRWTQEDSPIKKRQMDLLRSMERVFSTIVVPDVKI